MTSAPPEKPGPRKTFRTVALVFVGLLVVGFAAGVIVYQKYVAYTPTAARHVPSDVTVAVRTDLTHVMLYAPFRTSIIPLADRGDAAAAGRGRRLAAHGVRLGADVRELALALGPAPGDWLLVVGGQLPREGLSEIVRAVLGEEARTVEARPGVGYVVAPGGPWFGQAADGAFVIASSEGRLRAALPIGGSDAALSEAAGGLVLSRAWLGAPFDSLRASWRAGSVLAVEVTADVTEPSSGKVAFRSMLERLARLDPALTVPVQTAEIRATANRLHVRLNLPVAAVERLASLTAERVSTEFSLASN